MQLVRELLDNQRDLEQRVERMEYTLRIKRRRSRRPRAYEAWMPDFIAALRERTGHVEEAHELCQRRHLETPSLPTVYQRRRDCARFRGEWLEILGEAAAELRLNVAKLEETLAIMRAGKHDRLQLSGVRSSIRATKARLTLIERSMASIAEEGVSK